MGRRTPLPNMQTFAPSCLVTNVSSSIASSGVCTGITAAGVSLSRRSLKYSWVTTLKPRITARLVASSAMRGMPSPAVQHPGHHRRRPVAGVGRLPAPESLHRDAAFSALLGGHAERIRPAPLRLQETVGAEVARDFADLLGKDRGVLDPMSVAVDDWVREPLADFFGRMVRAHLDPPPTAEVRFRVSVCSQHNPSQTA